MVQRTEDIERIKERIEQRGSIAKEINLDVSTAQLQKRKSLLDSIIGKGGGKDFAAMQRPVIVVPAMLVPGNVGLSNIRSFLEDGMYCVDGHPEDREKLAQSAVQMSQVTFKVNGKSVTFDVYDNVSNFTETRWQRVVAVFVNGQDWQFKDWKNGDKKRELFARVRGYYIGYAAQKKPELVDGWNVKKLELQRHKRHHDVNVRNVFWNDFEEFLNREKFQGCDF